MAQTKGAKPRPVNGPSTEHGKKSGKRRGNLDPKPKPKS